MGTLSVEQLELRRLTRENRELRKYLHDHAVVIANTVAVLDAAMKRPSTLERGKTIGAAVSTLNYTNDCLLHFGLKYDFRKINKLKRRLEARSA